MNRFLIVICVCFFSLGNLSAQETKQFNFSNPYPFSDCTYKISVAVFVVDEKGSFAVPLETISTIVHPGDMDSLVVEIPEGKSIYSTSFTAEAFGSGVVHKDLGAVYDARSNGCITTKDAHTFWKPIDEDTFHIWEAMITGTSLVEE